MNDKKVSFSNRFQITVFNDFISLEFAYQMSSFRSDGTVNINHEIQSSQYINMTPSDAKQLAVLLVDTIIRHEQQMNTTIEMPEPFKTIWNERINNAAKNTEPAGN